MNNFKSFAVISVKAFFSWACINALTMLITLIAFGLGFFLLAKNIIGGQAFYGWSFGGAVMMLQMAEQRPLAFILLLLIAMSPLLFFVLSNKYVMKQMAQNLVAGRANGLIEPFIDNILHKFKESSPGLFNAGSNFVELKSKLIGKIKQETGNRLVRLVLISAVNKLTLNDADLSEKNMSFEGLLKVKILEALKNSVAPSLNSIIYVVAIQWVFVVFMYFSPY